jgi:hypothetical protein
MKMLSTPSSASTVDFDLHGLARIRLINPSAADVAALRRQLGPIQADVQGEADITIRFVETLPLSSRLRYLGANNAAFTEDAFLILRTKHKMQAKVKIPMQDVGGRCEIVCESGLHAVPLLIPILNLTVLARGALPLHAAAFTYQGTGALVTGWSEGGKTETLLTFMQHGATYVGDEWVYLTGDGKRMYGIPEPIRVWDWHLEQLPDFQTRVSKSERARMGAVKLAQGATNTLKERVISEKLASRTNALLKRQLCIDVHPQKLFDEKSFGLAGNLDSVFFVMSHESPDVVVEPIDPQEVANRMVFSLQYELQTFMSYYLTFRFAFPELSNPVIAASETMQRDLLSRILAGKDAYAVYHPYPVVFTDLYNAVRPRLERVRQTV